MGLLNIIRRMHLRQKLSIREIARLTGVSRNTVTKHLAAGTIEPVFSTPDRPSKIDPFADKLAAWLKTEAARSRKQRRTLKQLHTDLVALGFTGSYGRVAAFARQWRADRQREQQTTGRGTFVPLSFRPGEAFQFDWSEDFAVLGGERTKLQMAHIKLSHSRAFVLRAYLLQTHEMLFDAHWHGFRMFGGVPESGALAAYLTSPMWSDRPLGRSTVRMSLPARALVLMTGRNLAFSDDLARRILHCRLDPQVEVAYTRKFEFDPVSRVIADRPCLVAAGLTLIRASLTLDDRREAGSLASYEEWDNLVGRTVAWIAREIAPAEFIDPTAIFVRNGAETCDREGLHELLVELEAKFGNDEFKSRDVAFRAADDTELRDLVNDSGQRGLVPSAKSIGQLLLKMRDQPIAGRVLRTRQAGHIRKWRIAKTE